jgi:hypothetical protein
MTGAATLWVNGGAASVFARACWRHQSLGWASDL